MSKFFSHDAAVLDRALLVEQGGQAVDERARDLPVDLRRIDRVARIGRRDDAVDLDLVAAAFDRDLRRRRHVAVERLHVREARDARPAAPACPSRSSRPRH